MILLRKSGKKFGEILNPKLFKNSFLVSRYGGRFNGKVMGNFFS